MEGLEAQLDFLRETEVKEILEEAKRQASRLISEARERAEEVKRREMQEIMKRNQETETRELEIAGLEAKRKVMNLRFKLIETALDESSVKLKQMVIGEAPLYKNSLENFVIEAASHMNALEFELILGSKETEFIKKRLKKIEKEISSMKNATVTLKISDEPLRSIGGLVVRSRDRKQIFNNTLEARLAKVRQEKLPEISRVLFEGAQT